MTDTEIEMKKTTLRLPKKTHSLLMIAKVKRETTAEKLVAEALEMYLGVNGEAA